MFCINAAPPLPLFVVHSLMPADAAMGSVGTLMALAHSDWSVPPCAVLLDQFTPHHSDETPFRPDPGALHLSHRRPGG